jgi:glycosyltransferase involved in cell wall biosynthesis
MHRQKIQYACTHANAVIAASDQTKKDLVEMYKISAEKIVVGYQSCHAAFGQQASDGLKSQIRQHYQLPEQFFLYVGSVIERKNLLRICEAMQIAGSALHLPLVIVGNGGAYKEKVTSFLAANGLTSRAWFLSEAKWKSADVNLNLPENLSALYQMATALIYPSIFEGFGIPVLEAMTAGVPVITSNISSMPEIGADAVSYVDPFDVISIRLAMEQMQNNALMRKQLAEKGLQRSQVFSLQSCTAFVMNTYKNVRKHGSI